MHGIESISPSPLQGLLPALESQHSSPTHTVELALLLLCARMRVDSLEEARIRGLLQQEVDWNFLITTAHQHRVLPLLCRTLGRLNLGDVPEPAMSRLRSGFHANARRNLFLTAELFQVIDSLDAVGIPCIPYKGPVVASLAYGDISLRQFADLDIIVPVKDVARARELLVFRGYRPEKEMSEVELLALIQTEKDITLLRDDFGINLEIHWGITTDKDPIRIHPESLWENLESYSIAGKSVQTLAPEDLLLILCIHGAKHRWERLGWLCDIAEIVRSQGRLEWNRAVENATRLGGARILFHGLALARELLGAELPPRVLQAIEADPVIKPLSEQVMGWLFGEHSVALDLGEQERYFMRLREHPADRFRVGIKQAKRYVALTARDKETLAIPEFLTWSLYVLRPVRLIREYGLTPLKRFFSGMFQS